MNRKEIKIFVYKMILLIMIIATGAAMAAKTNLRIYPIPPDDRSNGGVRARVNGVPITFEYFRNFPTFYYDINYCRFAADGPIEVALNMGQTFKNAHLRGLLCDLPYSRKGNTLYFTLPGPGHYYLQFPDILHPIPGNPNSGTFTVAFWIDDLEEMDNEKIDIKNPDVTVVTNAGVISDPVKNQTNAIQLLLDKGGVLYFPAGIYRAGTLEVKSETEIYLAPGALIKAVDERSAIHSRFVYINNEAYVKIHGPGTIDANYDGYPGDTKNIHIVDVKDSHHIEFNDVCFRNCNSWAVHLFGSDHIRCHNIRILSGKDGIDPDSASDIMIDGVFIQAKDDAVAVKTRNPHKPTERVTIRNSIVASDASALKIGTETNALMRDIVFENCDVYDSDRGLVLYARDGGPVENVTWRNIRLFMIHWPHETGGTPVQLFIAKRRGYTSVKNINIEHINANVIVPIGFAGLAEAPLNHVSLRHISLRMEVPKSTQSYFRGNLDAYTPEFKDQNVAKKPDVFKVSENINVIIDGLFIDWQGNQDMWTPVTDVYSGLRISNLIQIN
ncbi:hypothetical protein GF407_20465 [candidate division KSB1 bacterium]|nr:hypothetical protein [candidate division KSB1 bacterium]